MKEKEKKYKALKSEILTRRTLSHRIYAIISKNKLRLLLFTLLGVAASGFVVSALLANKGTFTVTLPRQQMLDLGLVISDTAGFERPRHEIQGPPVIDMWNITRSDIPDDLHMRDGFNSDENYLAMTIYLKNMGSKNLDYTLAVDINEIFRDIDEALRIELYVNDEPETYAKRKSDKSGDPEPDTVPFVAKTRVISLNSRQIDVGQVEKFTLIAWIEGEDPDCTNELLGGFVKMTMNFDAKVRQQENGG